MKAVRRKPDIILPYFIKLRSAAFLQCAEYVYRRFERVCCLHLEGACGINWGIEKIIRQKRTQIFRIIARIVLSKGRR